MSCPPRHKHRTASYDTPYPPRQELPVVWKVCSYSGAHAKSDPSYLRLKFKVKCKARTEVMSLPPPSHTVYKPGKQTTRCCRDKPLLLFCVFSPVSLSVSVSAGTFCVLHEAYLKYHLHRPPPCHKGSSVPVWRNHQNVLPVAIFGHFFLFLIQSIVSTWSGETGSFVSH